MAVQQCRFYQNISPTDSSYIDVTWLDTWYFVQLIQWYSLQLFQCSHGSKYPNTLPQVGRKSWTASRRKYSSWRGFVTFCFESHESFQSLACWFDHQNVLWMLSTSSKSFQIQETTTKGSPKSYTSKLFELLRRVSFDCNSSGLIGSDQSHPSRNSIISLEMSGILTAAELFPVKWGHCFRFCLMLGTATDQQFKAIWRHGLKKRDQTNIVHSPSR